MTLSEIAAAIEQAEQQARYHDAAEGRMWFAERAASAANEARLYLLRQAKAAREATRDALQGMVLNQGLSSCERCEVQRMLDQI